MKATNVFEYFEEVFHVPPTKYSNVSDGLNEYAMSTHCGKECEKIINRAHALLVICDTHEHVVEPIQKGTLTACEIDR